MLRPLRGIQAGDERDGEQDRPVVGAPLVMLPAGRVRKVHRASLRQRSPATQILIQCRHGTRLRRRIISPLDN